MQKDLERCREIERRSIETGVAYGKFKGEVDRLISPDVFILSPKIHQRIEREAGLIFIYLRALNELYNLSLERPALKWVSQLVEAGEPEWIIRLQRSQALREQIPKLVRCDYMLTYEEDLLISEIESHPAGFGFTLVAEETFPGLEEIPGTAPFGLGLAQSFSQTLGAFGNEAVVILIGPKSENYLLELQFFSKKCRQLGAKVFAKRALELKMTKDGFFIEEDHLRVKALYSLSELYQFEEETGFKEITALAEEASIEIAPPPKVIFEKKLATLGLLFHPKLREVWIELFGKVGGGKKGGEGLLRAIQKLFPPTWIIEQEFPFEAEGKRIDWGEISLLPKSILKGLVIKYASSGFGASGGRKVFKLSSLAENAITSIVRGSLTAQDRNTGDFWIVQKEAHCRTSPTRFWEKESDTLKEKNMRTRLGVFFFDRERGRAIVGGGGIVLRDFWKVAGASDAVQKPVLKVRTGV